jgi:hypothetical protein
MFITISRLRVFEDRMPRRICESKRDEVTGSFMLCTLHQMRWTGQHVWGRREVHTGF